MDEARLDLNREIEARLGDAQINGVELQATAVLIDADLSEAERADAFGQMIVNRLGRLSVGELHRFTKIAKVQGEAAALAYLEGMATSGRGPGHR